MDNYPGLVNVEANLPAPGIEWEIKLIENRLLNLVQIFQA